MARELTFEALKAKHRELRDGFPQNLTLRVHRALSWLHRAEMSADDLDAKFIFLWISFNAVYSVDRDDVGLTSERGAFDEYFGKVLSLDAGQRIYDAIWQTFPGPIRLLLDNKYVFHPFWSHHNGVEGYEDWEDRFAKSKKKLQRALMDRDTKTILTTVFDRLYVLRNQLIHGGATWGSKVNRAQVGDGARIMSALLPVFIDLMMEHPEITWGAPFYPVVD